MAREEDIAMLHITYLAGFPMDLSAADREALQTFSRGLQAEAFKLSVSCSLLTGV